MASTIWTPCDTGIRSLKAAPHNRRLHHKQEHYYERSDSTSMAKVDLLKINLLLWNSIYSKQISHLALLLQIQSNKLIYFKYWTRKTKKKLRKKKEQFLRR